MDGSERGLVRSARGERILNRGYPPRVTKLSPDDGLRETGSGRGTRGRGRGK